MCSRDAIMAIITPCILIFPFGLNKGLKYLKEAFIKSRISIHRAPSPYFILLYIRKVIKYRKAFECKVTETTNYKATADLIL